MLRRTRRRPPTPLLLWLLCLCLVVCFEEETTHPRAVFAFFLSYWPRSSQPSHLLAAAPLQVPARRPGLLLVFRDGGAAEAAVAALHAGRPRISGLLGRPPGGSPGPRERGRDGGDGAAAAPPQEAVSRTLWVGQVRLPWLLPSTATTLCFVCEEGRRSSGLHSPACMAAATAVSGECRDQADASSHRHVCRPIGTADTPRRPRGSRTGHVPRLRPAGGPQVPAPLRLHVCRLRLAPGRG
jgi:hypothetical protein